MKGSTYTVQSLVREVRSRWRRKVLLQGLAITVSAALLAGLVWVLAVRFLEPTPAVSGLVALVGVVCVVGTAGLLLARPLSRRLTDAQIALFIEEQMPDLQDRVNSAVEIGSGAEVSGDAGTLVDRLLDDAAVRARKIAPVALIDERRERVFAYAAGALLLAFLAFTVSSMEQIRGGIETMELAIPVSQPFLTVEPGNVEIEKGESQEIIAALREPTELDLELHFREGEGEWQKAVMQAGLDAPTYLHEFRDIQASIDYFVSAGEERSEVFTLSLYEFPAVRQIDLTYTLPAYTRQAGYMEEDTGDIRALVGSRVQVDVRTAGTPVEGELVFEDETRVPMERVASGHFRATLTLERDGYYTVHLVDGAGKANKFPEEYTVTALEDLPPVVTVTDPRRDVRVNPIEEVQVAAEVYDDFGVRDVRLRYTVNAGEEQTAALVPADSLGAAEVEGDHLFFLEEYNLQPGDIISYYVEADDYLEGRASEASDLYFIEVIPYDQQFTQANNMGGGGGGQQGSQVVISQQQIITATWNLQRERADLEPDEVEASGRALVQAQENLKSNIEQRLAQTAFSLEMQADDESRQVATYLRQAVEAMGRAVVDLNELELKEALTPERQALNFLLRADALNRERQVSMNRQQGGGGGGGATEERMSELMDLELDISRDKYEMQQQRQQQQRSQEVDEALERVRELARKQESLANQSQKPMTEEEKRREIERLKRDQDELRQEAESLARNIQQMARQNDQVGRETDRELERVIDDMRQAEQAMRRGDMQEAMSRQRQAMNSLDRLQRDLQRTGADNAREQLENLAREFEELQNREEQLSREIDREQERMREGTGRPDPQAVERMTRQREAMNEAFRSFEEQAEALEEQARGDNQELARALRGLRRQLEQERVDEAMENARRALDQGWVDYADRLQEEIERGLERIDGRMQELPGSLPRTDEERIAEALDDVRDLMEEFEQMAAEQGRPGESRPGRSEQGQGQPGEQQRGNPSEQAGAPSQTPPSEGQRGSGGRSDQAEASRMERRLEQAREALNRLQEGVGGDARSQGLVRELQRNIGRADHTGQLLGENAKAYFEQQIFAPLSALEEALARQLDQIEMEKKLYGARKGDVPAAYRDLVEKYFEALAKSRE